MGVGCVRAAGKVSRREGFNSAFPPSLPCFYTPTTALPASLFPPADSSFLQASPLASKA
jgi:hypothetical protein